MEVSCDRLRGRGTPIVGVKVRGERNVCEVTRANVKNGRVTAVKVRCQDGSKDGRGGSNQAVLGRQRKDWQGMEGVTRMAEGR